MKKRSVLIFIFIGILFINLVNSLPDDAGNAIHFNYPSSTTGGGGGNSSFNATYNNLLNQMCPSGEVVNGTLSNGTFICTTVASGNSSGGNSSWNQSFANTLYASIIWGYNQTTPAIADINNRFWNKSQSYNRTEVWNRTETWNRTQLYNISQINGFNASWTSTFNATYASLNTTYGKFWYNMSTGSGISIGDIVVGGTDEHILFVNASGQLEQSDFLLYDAAVVNPIPVLKVGQSVPNEPNSIIPSSIAADGGIRTHSFGGQTGFFMYEGDGAVTGQEANCALFTEVSGLLINFACNMGQSGMPTNPDVQGSYFRLDNRPEYDFQMFSIADIPFGGGENFNFAVQRNGILKNKGITTREGGGFYLSSYIDNVNIGAGYPLQVGGSLQSIDPTPVTDLTEDSQDPYGGSYPFGTTISYRIYTYDNTLPVAGYSTVADEINVTIGGPSDATAAVQISWTSALPIKIYRDVDGGGYVESTGNPLTFGGTSPLYDTGVDFWSADSDPPTPAGGFSWGNDTLFRVETGGDAHTFGGLYTQFIGINGSATYPLTVNNNVSNISIWAETQVSATGYITRTDVYDTDKNGKALDNVKSDKELLYANGSINHEAFGYAYVEYDKLEIIGYNETYKTEEICRNAPDINISKPKIVCSNATTLVSREPIYRVVGKEKGVNLGKLVAKQEQALYETREENNLLKLRIEDMELRLNKLDGENPTINEGSGIMGWLGDIFT